MRNTLLKASLLFLCGTISLSGCSSSSVGTVSGQVTIDGVDAETGTISFKPADNPTGKGFGGALSAGRFEVPSNDVAKPGKYLVAVQAMKSTGKTRNDPQQGQVPILQPLELTDSPQEVEITSANAGDLAIAFHARK